MSIDFRRSQSSSVTVIKGETIQTVTNYKCLCIVLTHNKKSTSQRNDLFLMSTTECSRCSAAFTESDLTYCIIRWFGNATDA